jgi:Ca2+-binding EF-hand superfamily protein
MKKKSLIILGVIVCAIVIFLGYIFIYKQNGKGSNSLIVLKGETLTGKELLKKISNENVDIEQKITDGVVIDINKSMLDTDMYEVVDVVYLGNNKIKLVVKNKTIVEVVEKEEGVITEPETKKRKLGDIYYDDSIDIRDLVKYAQYVDGLNAFSSSDLEYADLNNDGYYDLIDVDILSHCVAGATKYCDFPVTNYDLEVYGDLNRNHKIDSIDMVKLAQYVEGKIELEDSLKLYADLNLDNKIDYIDVDILSRKIVGDEKYQKLPIRNLDEILNYGNVDNLTGITYKDLTKLYNYIKGNEELKGIALLSADLNKDGKIDYADLTILHGYLNKIKGYATLPNTNISKSIIYGDINQDGKVDEKDATLLSQYLAKWNLNLNPNQLLAMDVNLDGKVDGKDQIILARYLAKESGYTELPYLNNVKQVVYGDANKDGKVDYIDLNELNLFLQENNQNKFDALTKIAVDLNKDGKIDYVDLTILHGYLKRVSGFEKLPNEKIKTISKYGDLNNDGIINQKDADILAEMMGKNEIPSGVNAIISDIYMDGSFDIRDLLALGQFIAGTIKSIPTLNTNDARTYGDLNGDGKVDYTDLKNLYLLTEGKYSLNVKYIADLNKDGKINMVDVTILHGYLNKMNGYETLPNTKITSAVKYGNVNRDVEVDEKDYKILQQYLAKWYLNLSSNQLLAMDVNLDGKINGVDSTILKGYINKDAKYSALPFLNN